MPDNFIENFRANNIVEHLKDLASIVCEIEKNVQCSNLTPVCHGIDQHNN